MKFPKVTKRSKPEPQPAPKPKAPAKKKAPAKPAKVEEAKPAEPAAEPELPVKPEPPLAPPAVPESAVPARYPRYLEEYGVVAQTEAEHKALLRGDATVEVVLASAAGEKRAIVMRKEKG
jgi:hypothetical protein